MRAAAEAKKADSTARIKIIIGRKKEISAKKILQI